jgi:hypothetical protein
MNTFKATEKGQAIYLIVFGVVTLIGFTALSIDGGRIMSARRDVQNAADSSALAGALAECQGEDVATAALNSADENDYDNNGSTNTVSVHHPPSTGLYTGNTDYVEVYISTQVERGLSQLVFGGQEAADGRAVAHCDPSTVSPVGEGNAIIGLSDSGIGLNANGNGNIFVNSGGIHVNSSDSNALEVNGNGDVVADTIDGVGGYVINNPNGTFDPLPTSGAPYYDDPLVELDPPTNPYSGACTTFHETSGDHTITPGLYCEINVSLNGNLYMESGTYVVDGGDFSITSNGDISADPAGVIIMLINGSNFIGAGNGSLTLVNSFIYVESGSFTLAGNGVYDVTGPTSGPWAGMTLFMDQSNTSPVTVVGNSSSFISGLIYAPVSTVNVEGNGGIFGSYTQIIGNNINVTGNGDIVINFDPSQIFQYKSNSKISLVE